MGLMHSQRTLRTQELESTSNDIYKYPPKSGNYFGSYFYMGGERFDTMRPDAYLFGENEDLNFLGNKPAPFNFSLPQANEASKTLKSLINIRKDSLKLVKIGDSDHVTKRYSILNQSINSDSQLVNQLESLPIPSIEPQITPTNTKKINKRKNKNKNSSSSPTSSAIIRTEPTTNINSNNTNVSIDMANVNSKQNLTNSNNTDNIINNNVMTTSNTTNKSISTTNSATNNNTNNQSFTIEFTFDTDVKCAITIFYFATEDSFDQQAIFLPKDANMNSETFHYKRGSNQVFSQSSHTITPSLYPDSQWQYDSSKDVIPVVIQCVAEEEGQQTHSHCTFAAIDRHSDAGFSIKALKQKQWIGGVPYLLQEIYGIENKNVETNKEEDTEDTGSECVICMSECRDTIILPCRHLCLCNGCADNLRYQANNCPICRAKFRALLQFKAIQKKNPNRTSSRNQESTTPGSADDDRGVPQDGVPPGFEAISLVEALNGPTLPHRARQVPTNLPHESVNLQHTNPYVNLNNINNNNTKDNNDDDDDENDDTISNRIILSNNKGVSRNNNINNKNSNNDVDGVVGTVSSIRETINNNENNKCKKLKNPNKNTDDDNDDSVCSQISYENNIVKKKIKSVDNNIGSIEDRNNNKTKDQAARRNTNRVKKVVSEPNTCRHDNNHTAPNNKDNQSDNSGNNNSGNYNSSISNHNNSNHNSGNHNSDRKLHSSDDVTTATTTSVTSEDQYEDCSNEGDSDSCSNIAFDSATSRNNNRNNKMDNKNNTNNKKDDNNNTNNKKDNNKNNIIKDESTSNNKNNRLNNNKINDVSDDDDYSCDVFEA